MRVRRKTSVGIAIANREGEKEEQALFSSLSVAYGMVLISSHFS